MTIISEVRTPSRHILCIVTVGGTTNSAPILEVAKILHDRGHKISFATLSGREYFAAPYPFVSGIYTVGREITPEEDEACYIRFGRWDWTSGRKDILAGKKFFDGFWTETYVNLKKLVAEIRPDFLFADYEVDAARDIMAECKLPLAMMWPQMPWLMLPQPYIPGQPGMQQLCLTSEHASLWDRFYEDTYLFRSIFTFLNLHCWTKKMRRKAGVKTMLPLHKKPDYLIFTNICWGIEAPKDVPPLVESVGPILSDTITPVTGELEAFLGSHTRVVYIAFGTHAILPFATIRKVVEGIQLAIGQGHLDGVVWAMRAVAQRQLEGHGQEKVGTVQFIELLSNRHPQWRFEEYAPQRAILDHQSTCLFLSHCGASSTNEGIYHGVPILAMGIFGDQSQNSLRLKAAGVALMLDKHSFTAAELAEKVAIVRQDASRSIARNVLRMQRIATAASRRKHLAADLIEEVLYDHELRFEFNPRDTPGMQGARENAGRGRELRPMHRQTADMRMGWLKARNLDMWLVVFGTCLLCGVPLYALSWFAVL